MRYVQASAYQPFGVLLQCFCNSDVLNTPAETKRVLAEINFLTLGRARLLCRFSSASRTKTSSCAMLIITLWRKLAWSRNLIRCIINRHVRGRIIGSMQLMSIINALKTTGTASRLKDLEHAL